MKVFFIFIFPLVALFSGCQSAPDKTIATAKPKVLVSIAPFAYFVERVAQGGVEVQILAPRGADPHSYEPTPKQVQEAFKADLWLRIGEPFEEKILNVLKQENPHLLTLQMWEGIPLLPLEEEHDHPHVHVHGEEAKDHHVWLSPRNAKIEAERIFEALCKLSPENRPLFEGGLKSFLTDLRALDKEISFLLSPFKGEALLVSHPAFGYFCRDYGLIQLSIECEGKETLPQRVTQTVDLARKYHVRSILTQSQYGNKGAELIAKELDLPVHSVDPYALDYLENLRHLAQVIAHP